MSLHRQTIISGAGISTCCPSPTTSVLGLVPTYPGWMNLPQETLGLRRLCFSHRSRYSYRHSLFCTVHQSSRSGFCPYTMLLYRCLRIPPLRCRVLAPLHFRRWITRPVSYYALFECVAASKPTSWLSVQSNILSHLTRTWGP